jgi:hypothetical protein
MEEPIITNEKKLNHKSKSVVSSEKVKVINSIDVLLLGYLDNPRIKCMK